MSLLTNWNSAEKAFGDALIKAKTEQRPVPKQFLALLKTASLKKALKLADDSEAKDDLDGVRKALAGATKFFMMYGNVLKAAHKAFQELPNFDDELNTELAMFGTAIPRAQTGLSQLNTDMTKARKKAATDDTQKEAAAIKEILTPMKFQYDWKAGKEAFEKATKKKKPSEKILLAFRKSTGVENALAALDKACEAVKPADYQKAYAKYVQAKDDYLKVLTAAVNGAKATADPIYKEKCEGLRDLLGSIDTRAGKINKGLEDLED